MYQTCLSSACLNTRRKGGRTDFTFLSFPGSSWSFTCIENAIHLARCVNSIRGSSGADEHPAVVQRGTRPLPSTSAYVVCQHRKHSSNVGGWGVPLSRSAFDTRDETSNSTIPVVASGGYVIQRDSRMSCKTVSCCRN